MADLEQAGKRMQTLGCGLTLLLTVPILGLAFFGMLGLIIGGLIGLLLGVGLVAQAFEKQPPG